MDRAAPPTIITPRKDTVISFSVLGQIFWAGQKWRQIRKCSCLIDGRRRDARGNGKELVTQSISIEYKVNVAHGMEDAHTTRQKEQNVKGKKLEPQNPRCLLFLCG